MLRVVSGLLMKYYILFITIKCKRGERILIKKVIVALDGSESANQALDLALDVAEKYTADILLLSIFHSYLCRVRPSYLTPEEIQPCLEKQKAYHEKVLSEALKKVNRLKPNLNVSTKLKEGRPTDKIIETAKEGNFDLIVMGSRGIGGITQLLLGSVSDRVADHAPCAVLIVK